MAGGLGGWACRCGGRRRGRQCGGGPATVASLGCQGRRVRAGAGRSRCRIAPRAVGGACNVARGQGPGAHRSREAQGRAGSAAPRARAGGGGLDARRLWP
eukprot:876544-Alexandrium_andersonii.AAC.1